MLFELFAEFGDKRDGGHGGRIRRGANGLTHHLLRNLQHQIEIFALGVAAENIMQNFAQPSGTFAARRALSARFMVVKMHNDLQQVDHAIAVVNHDDRARSQHAAHLREALIIHGCLHSLIGRQHRRGGAPGNNGFKFAAGL